jgi:hypothetical protein
MAYQATVIPVMLASPGDVGREREIAREVIHNWNYVHSATERAVLMPVGWETHSSPELSGRPQELINDRVLKDCDLLIGIFWTRLGTPTGEFSSGTAEEIQRHIEAGKPAMVYFSTVPVALETIDLTQYEALKKFRQWCQDKGLVWTFDSPDDFRLKFDRQLRIALQQNKYLESLLTHAESVEEEQEEPRSLQLSDDERELLLEATLDNNAEILHGKFTDAEFFQTNRKTFGQSDARERARWKYAMEQLEERGLVRPLNAKRHVYEVTHAGFEIADSIRAAGG